MKPAIRQRPLPAGPALDGLHPVLDRIYRSRGLRDSVELSLSLEGLLPSRGLRGLSRAAELLADALTSGRRITLIGDFDADGATSVALGVLALRAMGADSPDYLVPNRFHYGYGLTRPIVDLAARQGAELLVTVDNGISSLEGVDLARELGLQVIVTDHHLPGPAVPAADAIVNPNLAGDEFPSKHLAGVGVIFYVMAGLRQELRRRGWFRDRSVPEPALAGLLDLVALGTVADVVPMDRNNRILVEQGLRRIRAGCCRPALTALLEVAGRDPAEAVAADLAFAAGPRLNAAGRLEDMGVGIECLLAEDPRHAAEHARRLDALNRQRRTIESDMQAQAVADIESRLPTAAGDTGPALCLFARDWHQGVVGILASRLKERFHRPAVVFAPAGNGAIKGSGRSVPGLHLRDVLARVDALHPGLLDRFGGHAAAAGLTLAEKRFGAFRDAFLAVVEELLPPEALQAEILTDGPLDPPDLSLDLAQAIRRGGPWGQAFPEPLFHGTFRVISRRIVGEHHLRLRLRHPDPDGGEVDAIAFGALDRGWDGQGEHVELLYRLGVNQWQGRTRLQLVVENLFAASPQP